MKGDFSRSTFQPARHYTSVRMQQGRVQLDADWNEQDDIETHLDRTTRVDVIGASGTPKTGGGFALALPPSSTDLMVSAGRLYVDGILCELEPSAVPIRSFLADNRVTVPVWAPDGQPYAKGQWVRVSAQGVADALVQITDIDEAQQSLTFQLSIPQFKASPSELRRMVTLATQPDFPNAPALAPVDNQTDLLYLDVWERHITAVEDPYLREVALGGPDTATRVQTVWQVRAVPNVGAIDCKDTSHFPAAGDARLTTAVVTPPASQDPCIVPATGGYRGLENQLYRVEIHDGGAPYGFPRSAGAPAAAVTGVNGKQVTVDNLSTDGRGWGVGQAVELFSTQSDARNQGGTLATITAIDAASKTLTLDTDVSALAGDSNRRLRRIPTFKWSRDNASVVLAVRDFSATDKTKLTLRRLGRDQILGLSPNDWVEVLGDASELNGLPGTMAQIVPNGVNADTFELTLAADVSAYKPEGHPKVRRWDKNVDQSSALIPIKSGPIDLEDGIRVSFDGTMFRPGDYWSFAARTATAEVEHLAEAPAQGIAHHYCALALVTWHKNGESWNADIKNCAPPFPSLTTICADDVCFDNSDCKLVDAVTVQDALDRLCQERDLRFHNKNLHGWGIVCGLEVDCGPANQDGVTRNVTVRQGYAIDCEGNDLILKQDDSLPLMDMVSKAEILKQGQDGEVSLTMALDHQNNVTFGVEKYNPTPNTLQALLAGTLLMDFYNDCIKNIVDFLRNELTPPQGEKDLPAGPVTQRISALTNLLAQPVNPVAGQNIFISPREDKILHEFYDTLRAILSSETFCAMFENARPFPAYPLGELGMDTIFGKGEHTRIRLRPGAAEAYTVGPGLNPLTPSTTLNRYDLNKKLLIEVIDPVLGGDAKSGGQSGQGSVQDVAFSPDGRVIYTIVATRDNQNTIFRAGDIGADGAIRWRAPVTFCGVRLVTLGVNPSDKINIYAVGAGKGLYQFNPNSIDVNMAPTFAFTATGHLVVTADGRAYATGNTDPNQPSSYTTVHDFNLSTHTALHANGFALKGSGQDDIAVYTTADGAKTETLYAVMGTGGQARSINYMNLSDLNPQTIALGDNSPVHLQPYAPAGMLLMTIEDRYCLQMIDMRQNQLVAGYLLPMQVAPIAVTSDRKLETGYVLNYLSNTITVIPGKLFDPKFRFDLKALANYRAAVIEAFTDLLAGFLQYLKDCFCDHFLVKCRECGEQAKLYLACVTIRKDRVYKVCNFSKRHYVKTFPTVGYWLSLVPIVPLAGKLVEEFCCMILPDLFSKYKVAGFQETAPQQSTTRFQASALRNTVGMIQSTDVTANVRRLFDKNLVTTRILGESLQQPSLIERARPAPPIEIAGKTTEESAAHFKDIGVAVKTQPYDPSDPANLTRLAGFYRQPDPGSQVTLYEKDGVVQYYSVAPADRTTELRAELGTLSESVQSSDSKLQQVQARVDAQQTTLSHVDTLSANLADTQNQLAQRNQELTSLQSQFADLQKAHASLQSAVAAAARVPELETQLAQSKQALDTMQTNLAQLQKSQVELQTTAAAAARVPQLESQLADMVKFREQVTRFMGNQPGPGKPPA